MSTMSLDPNTLEENVSFWALEHARRILGLLGIPDGALPLQTAHGNGLLNPGHGSALQVLAEALDEIVEEVT